MLCVTSCWCRWGQGPLPTTTHLTLPPNKGAPGAVPLGIKSMSASVHMRPPSMAQVTALRFQKARL